MGCEAGNFAPADAQIMKQIVGQGLQLPAVIPYAQATKHDSGNLAEEIDRIADVEIRGLRSSAPF